MDVKKYPAMQRQNMRHRGPMEAKKMNRFQQEADHDIKAVSVKVENNEKKLAEYNAMIDEFISYEKQLEEIQKNIFLIGGYRLWA